MSQTRFYVLYSKIHASQSGTVYYKTEDGREIECTAAYRQEEEMSEYNYPDIEYRGYGEYSREGQKGDK